MGGKSNQLCNDLHFASMVMSDVLHDSHFCDISLLLVYLYAYKILHSPNPSVCSIVCIKAINARMTEPAANFFIVLESKFNKIERKVYVRFMSTVYQSMRTHNNKVSLDYCLSISIGRK